MRAASGSASWSAATGPSGVSPSPGWRRCSATHPTGRSGPAAGSDSQNGERKIDPDLLRELIAILGMDPDEAYEALGWWPPGVTRRDVQEMRRRRSDRKLEGHGSDDPGGVVAMTAGGSAVAG